jgi:hypothetical protein
MNRKTILWWGTLLFFCPVVLSAQDLSGDWIGQLDPADKSHSIRFLVSFTHDGNANTLTGPLRLEWPNDETSLKMSIIHGHTVNAISDRMTGQLTTADIDLLFPAAIDPPNAGDQVIADTGPWVALHLIGKLTSGLDGYQIKGTSDRGDFTLYKKYTPNQLLSNQIEELLIGYEQQGEFETDAAYGTRIAGDGPIKDWIAANKAKDFFQTTIGSSGLKMTYDKTTEQFTIDPTIGKSFIVKVPLEMAPLFKKQFPDWLEDYFPFGWDTGNRMIVAKAFVVYFYRGKLKDPSELSNCKKHKKKTIAIIYTP